MNLSAKNPDSVEIATHPVAVLMLQWQIFSIAFRFRD